MDVRDRHRLLGWRNSPHVRNVMLSTAEISAEKHNGWFHRVLLDQRSRYLVFEFDAHPVGLVYFTGIDNVRQDCRWGLYLGEEGLPKGLGTAMGALSLDWIFDNERVNTVFAEVIAGNARSLAFHRKLGFTATNRVPEDQEFCQRDCSIWFRIDTDSWGARRQQLGLATIEKNQ